MSCKFCTRKTVNKTKKVGGSDVLLSTESIASETGFGEDISRAIAMASLEIKGASHYDFSRRRYGKISDEQYSHHVLYNDVLDNVRDKKVAKNIQPYIELFLMGQEDRNYPIDVNAFDLIQVYDSSDYDDEDESSRVIGFEISELDKSFAQIAGQRMYLPKNISDIEKEVLCIARSQFLTKYKPEDFKEVDFEEDRDPYSSSIGTLELPKAEDLRLFHKKLTNRDNVLKESLYFTLQNEHTGAEYLIDVDDKTFEMKEVPHDLIHGFDYKTDKKRHKTVDNGTAVFVTENTDGTYDFLAGTANKRSLIDDRPANIRIIVVK